MTATDTAATTRLLSLGGRWLLVLALAALPACDCRGTKLASDCGITFTPATTEDFGTVALNQSVSLPLSIANHGNATLTIVSAVASGDNSFTVESLTTSQITAGNSVDIQITFTPTTAGPHTASLVVTTDDTCSSPTTTLTLTGIGTSYGVTVAPTSLDFSCVAVGAMSAAQTVTLTNISNPPAPEAIELTLSGPSDFELSPSATEITLAASGTYQFTVTFAPTAVGVSQAAWSIAACDGDGGCTSISLPMSGTGSTTTLVASPMSVDFGVIPVGETTSKQVLVQAQAAPAGSSCALPVTVEVPTLEAGDAGFSLLTDGGWAGGVAMTLTPPASVPLEAIFEGQTGNTFADTAVVQYALLGQSQPSENQLQVPLEAQTAANPCQDLTVTPAAVSFGTVPLGATVNESVEVSNPGDAVCEVTAITLTNDAYDEFGLVDGGTPLPFFLAPGGAQPVQLDVSFTNDNATPPDQRRGHLNLSATEYPPSDAGGPSSTTSVPLSATVEASACNGQVCLEISSWFDGESQLNIQGSNVWWVNTQFCVPGEDSTTQTDTTLTSCGVDAGWCPWWPTPGAEDGGWNFCQQTPPNCSIYGAATSAPFTTLTPPMPATTQPNMTLSLTACRNSCSITQLPDSSNGYTTIVDINDAPTPGAAIYDVTLCYDP